MRIFVLDITSRNADQYDPQLCNKLSEYAPLGSEVILLSNSLKTEQRLFKFIKLLDLIPRRFMTSKSKIKKAVRFFEVCLNYIFILFYCAIKKPDILHIQWLTLIDICSGEKYIISLLKFLSSKTKVYLTIHNIFPHDMPTSKYNAYKKRFLSVSSSIDGFFVHLNSAKEEAVKCLNLPKERIFVTYHGIYVRNSSVISSCNSIDKFRIIMYGIQNRYKGTDILMESLKLLPPKYLENVFVHIIGKTDPSIYNEYQNMIDNVHVKWDNAYVSNDYLDQSINNSDLIILPYRKISQSGVLLLALSCNKLILTSNLPSFLETLDGYKTEWFFVSEDARSLSEKIIHHMDGTINKEEQLSIINSLVSKYSWENTAKATLKAYNK